MAGRKNGMLKNIFVMVLFVCAVIQTGMLWLDGNSSHNFFYYLFEQQFAESDDKGPVEGIPPKDTAVGNGNNTFKILYGTEEKIDDAVSSVIQSAVSNSDGQIITDFLWQDCLSNKCAVYEFGISVPFNEYFNGIGVSERKAPNSPKNFTSIVVVPSDSNNKYSQVYFVDTSLNSNEAVMYTSDVSLSLSNEIDRILNDSSYQMTCISTSASGFNIFSDNFFVPQFSTDKSNFYAINENKCIDLTGSVTTEYIESATEQYFGSYSSKNVSFEPSGVYTISDSTNVVKCYPYGVLEYFNYGFENTDQQQSLSSAYYVCREFLNKDTSIKTDYYLSDVKITGEGALFCFDYSVNGMPVIIGGNIKNEYGIDHAMEVLISGNNVRKFKKYNSNFELNKQSSENITIDFLTSVNYSMVLKGGDNYKIDGIVLGYYLSDEADSNSNGICWFVNIDSTVYIIDAVTGNLRIK